MLGSTANFQIGLETSTPLGANGSSLPARAVFFQHPEQRHALAVAVADRSAGEIGCGLCRCGAADPDAGGGQSANAAYKSLRASAVHLARADQGFAPNGDLAVRLRRRH